MAVFKRGQVWWMSFSFKGKQQRRSCETCDKRLAEKIYAKVLTQLTEGKWFDMDESRQRTYEQMMDRFMEEHAPTVSVGTQRRYKSLLIHLTEFFSGMTLDMIDADKVLRYAAMRRAQNNSRPGTRNRELGMLSKALNLARLWKWVKENPCELVKNEKEHNENFGKCLTEEEEVRLLAAAKGKCNGLLDKMILVAINTGVREAELLNMKIEKVNFKERKIVVIQKGDIEKVVPMNDTVFKILLSITNVRSTSGYVFISSKGTRFNEGYLRRAFGQARNKAEINKGFRFHDLRHTCGTRLAVGGHDLYAIAAVLGHSQLSTAKRYAKHNVASLHKVVSTLG